MNPRTTRLVIGTLTGSACVLVLIDAPGFVRVPVVVLFAVVVPGLVATATIPELTRLERVSIVGAVSLAVLVTVSLAVVLLDIWSGAATLAVVGIICIVALARIPEKA